MENMTVKQTINALKESKYLVFRFSQTGVLIGVNSGILKTKKVKQKLESANHNSKTRFISYRPCGFQEYITYKRKFM